MKTAPFVLIIIVSMMALLPGCACGRPGGAVPEDNSTWAAMLAEQYSPIVLLKNDEDPRESFEPAPVETMISQAVIRETVLPSFTEIASLFGMAQYSGSDYYLDIPGISPSALRLSVPQYITSYEAAKAGGFTPTVYARVTQPGDSGHTVVQYWLFYYFDEWSNLHEGDWELVELVFPGLSSEELLSRNVAPLFAAYSQHQAGQRLSWEEMQGKGLISGTHPLVYVARGSHANYFTPGQYWLISDFDDTGLSGWRPLTPRVVMISAEDPGAGNHQWLNFQGFWGEHLDFTLSWRNLVWTQCGPNGPAWGSQGQQSQRWRQPFHWADNLAAYPQVYFASFLPEFARDWPVLAIFSVFSPAEIHVYDRYGNHAGLNQKGEFETQIPGAEYITLEGSESKTIIIRNGDLSQQYRLVIKGTGVGTMDIKAQVPDAANGIKRYLEYRDVPVTPATTAMIEFTEVPFTAPPSNSASVRDNATVLEIDRNGDGKYESEVKPGTSGIISKVGKKLTLRVEGAGYALAKDGYEYEENSSAYITAVPEKGWVFDRWGGDAAGSYESVSVVMDSDKTVIAYFKPEVKQFSLTIGIQGKGTTRPGPGTYFYDEGARVVIQAFPQQGYELAGWGADYGSAPALELVVNRDISITATFRQIPVIDQSSEPLATVQTATYNIMPGTGARQAIITQSPILVAVEVKINTLGLDKGGDTITMEILDTGLLPVASISQFVPAGFQGWRRFELPGGGISFKPGTGLFVRLKDTGYNAFGWEHDGDTYRAGVSFFDGKIYDGDFLFRTYGITGE